MNQTAETDVRVVRDSGESSGSARPIQVSRFMRDRLVRLAYRFLWNQADAEDAAQDALATALARRADLRSPDKWWPWLCRILVTRCHQQGRERRRRERHEEASDVTPRDALPPAASADPTETKELVRRMIQKLPQRQQEVIVLRHLQQMSYQEIAEVLGIAPSTARVHARAGREALRDLIAQDRVHED
jgi:RNA polymerase sigma-70 factor (ECF subfamily)